MKRTVKFALLTCLIMLVMAIMFTSCNIHSDNHSNCKHDDPSQIENIGAVAPTCRETGLTAGLRCNLCGTMVVPQLVAQTINCIESGWIVDKDVTETEDGAQHTECIMCGKRMREEIINAGVSIGLKYTVNSDKKSCTVTGIGSCKDLEIVIPNVIDGYMVTSIGSNAFYDCSYLTSVIIRKGLTSIGNYAFGQCDELKSIVIPDSVTNIEENVFYGCDSLKEITFEGTVAQWNDIDKADSWNRFWWNESVHSFTIYCANGIISENDEVTYYSSNGLLLKLNDDRETYTVIGIGNCTDSNIVIPAIDECLPITAIGESAFSGCTNITSVIVGNSVTSIGFSAFSGCSKLESVTLPFVGATTKTESDTYQYPFGYIFGTDSYDGGVATQQYYYGRYIENTGVYTRYYIPASLKSVTITGGNILYGAFDNCSGLTSITIPDRITSIGDSAFRGCSSLQSITIPSSVTSIGKDAFSRCARLTNITLPDSVTSIGNNAFYFCTYLSHVTLSSNVASIGKSSFYGCSALTNISIPASVTSIELGAFGACRNLMSITVDEKNEHYKTMDGNLYTKDGKTFIQYAIAKTDISFNVPDSVTSICDYAFYFCANLKSVIIPDSVTDIGVCAFESCDNLYNITIPVGLTKISSSMFYLCSSLTIIKFGGTLEQWEDIKKGTSWDKYTASYSIYCTDGRIGKNGMIIYY